MRLEFKTLITSFKEDIHSNKKAAIFEIISFALLFLVLLSLPLFSYRDNLNIITLLLSILASISMIIYVFLLKKITLNIYCFCTISFMIFALLVTALTSKDFNYIRSIFTVSSFSLVLFEFLLASKKQHLFIYEFLLSIFIFSIVFIIRYNNKIFTLTNERLGEDYGNVNEIGMYFAIAFFFLIYLIGKKKGIWFLFLFVTLLFAYLSYTTESKKSYLIIAFSCFAF